MKVMTFDLSTACIGIVTAEIEGKKIKAALSCPIIPPKFNPEALGYMKSKKKLSTTKGEMLNTYVKLGETKISKAEKQRRDREVRMKKDTYVLDHISNTMGNMIKKINPDLILVEKNCAGFNGMLTIVLLAKLMGTLLGIAGMLRIPVKEYAVNVVRSILNTTVLTTRLVSTLTEEELRHVPDVTKRALRFEMQNVYGKFGIDLKSDDEGDAAVVLHYWFTKEFGGIL